MSNKPITASESVATPSDARAFFESPGRYRTIAHILRLHRPSLDRLVAASPHPLEIYHFLVTSGTDDNPHIEINEDVDLPLRVVSTREMREGEEVVESDFDADSAELCRLDATGRPQAFFYCWTEFFEQNFCFDFRPAHPQQNPDFVPVRFPVRQLIELRKLNDTIRPLTLLPILSKHHWPPAPCYFPDVLAYVHGLPSGAKVDDQRVIEILCKQTQGTWRDRVNCWAKLGVAAKRQKTLTRGIERHFAGDYISATHIFATQIEGLMRDHLDWAGEPSCSYGSIEVVTRLTDLVTNRTWILGSSAIRRELMKFIEHGVFRRKFLDVVAPDREISRHGVAHGLLGDVDSAELSWRYLALTEGLVQMLLLDRVASGKEF